MYEDDSELTSYSESRLDSSFSKSHIYEKLVRKQMSNGDPEFTSILKDNSSHGNHSHRTPSHDGGYVSSEHQYDNQANYDHRRTSTHADQRSTDQLNDSQSSYGRRTPTFHEQRSASSDHRSSSHYLDREFHPIGNRSVSVDNLNSNSERERSQSYDVMSGRRSVDRNHRETSTSSSAGYSHNRQSSSYSNDDHHHPSEQKFLSGLPPVSPARRSGSSSTEKRSSTPDSYSHSSSDPPAVSSPGQPVVKSALITNRTAPLPSTSSRPSSRSSLPISASSGKDDATKIQDLEDTIVTLKKLLSDRDKETNLTRKENQDLHATNCQLKTQLEDYKKEGRKTPVTSAETENSQPEETQTRPVLRSDVTPASKSEYERKINQLINERENLETEMWKLRQQLGERADGTCSDDSSAVLDNYKPNNPYALQRKIDELESQIQDLNEANETSVAGNSKTDREIQKLRQENEKLKEELANSRKDLDTENQRLREEVDKLKSAQPEGVVMNGSLDEYSLQREVHALRQDLRFLRDKNHQLNEDNIKLIEHLQDLRRREKEQSLSPQSHIPLGILDKHGDQWSPSTDGKPPTEYRKFSPIPSIRGEKDAYPYHSSPSNKYSSGNLRPPSHKVVDPESSYKLEQFNGTNQRNQNLRQTFIHDMDLKPDRQQHKPRSILRKKAPPISLEYRNSDSTRDSTADRYQEINNLGELHKTHKRSGSAGSSSSLDSILDELEQEFGVSVGRPNHKRRTRARSAGSVEQRAQSSRSGSPQPMDSIGFRSISPKPIPTQHNRGLLGIGSPDDETFSTLGKRPFAPRNPADIHIHDIVKFARQGGRICRGLVKFIGHLPGRNDTYMGVELDKDEGKHDGTFETVRYFKCKPNKGVFVAFNKVVMAWGS